MKRLGTNEGTAPAALITEKVQPAARRMMLSAVQQNTSSGGEKIVLFAPEGWGKTTWAAGAEKPIFISTEDGLKGVRVDTFPEPRTWQDMFDAVQELRTQDHAFKSLVIDTIDWAENLCHAALLDRDKKGSIEDYGYGKGYIIASEEWKKLLPPLDALRREKGMNIICLAHAAIRTFNNPTGENWDRYELKTDKRISSLMKEWSDCVLFGNYDVAIDLKKGQSKGKGYGSERVLFTSHGAGYDAKNRYALPDQISANPKDFWSAIKKEAVK